MFLNTILWTLMECLRLFKAAKFGSLKMHIHVLCKVGKNIIFQNKTFLVMFHRQNKTFWYQFCNFKNFLKAEIVKTVWPVHDTASQWSLLSTLYLSCRDRISFRFARIKFDFKVSIITHFNGEIDSHIWMLRESLRESILGFSPNF